MKMAANPQQKCRDAYFGILELFYHAKKKMLLKYIKVKEIAKKKIDKRKA